MSESARRRSGVGLLLGNYASRSLVDIPGHLFIHLISLNTLRPEIGLLISDIIRE
jgi:hypothetical protein